MRKIALATVLSLCFVSCKGQTNDREYASMDFFKHINPDYIDIMQFEFNSINITTPYYEYSVKRIKIGDACLFAITKEYPEEWIKGALTGECSKKTKYGSLICIAKQLFRTDTTVLKESLDLYVFFIDRKDLEGPFYEEAEGGISENYYPKPDGTIIIYKYDGKGWLKIDSQKNSEIPRFFGESYMEKLAEEKISEYLKKKQ